MCLGITCGAETEWTAVSKSWRNIARSDAKPPAVPAQMGVELIRCEPLFPAPWPKGCIERPQ
jgi:hypothetical protein